MTEVKIKFPTNAYHLAGVLDILFNSLDINMDENIIQDIVRAGGKINRV